MASRAQRHRFAITRTLKERTPLIRKLYSVGTDLDRAHEKINALAAITATGHHRRDIDPNEALTPAECEQLEQISEHVRHLMYEINQLAGTIRSNEPHTRLVHQED